MNDRTGNAVLFIAVFCAVSTTAAVVHREFALQPARTPWPQGVQVTDWTRVASRGYGQGPEVARITIVEFFDFQCPACRMLSYSLDTLLQNHSGDLRLIRRHFPIRLLHPRAYEIAVASECGAQMGHFDEFYHAAFDQQSAIADADDFDLLQLMPQGSDTARMRVCIEDPGTAAVVDADIAVGRQLRLRATPSLVINGRLYTGAFSAASLDSIIAEIPS